MKKKCVFSRYKWTSNKSRKIVHSKVNRISEQIRLFEEKIKKEKELYKTLIEKKELMKAEQKNSTENQFEKTVSSTKDKVEEKDENQPTRNWR